MPVLPDSPDQGELPPLTQLILDVTKVLSYYIVSSISYLHATLHLGTPSKSPLSSYGPFRLSCCSEFAATSII